MNASIWHNPRCSKSRQTLQLLQDRGIEADVVEYLKQPPEAAEIARVLALLDRKPRELMRSKEAEYKELGLDDQNLSDKQLIAAMVRTPKLIERPVVLANGKAAVGRPPEDVLKIL